MVISEAGNDPRVVGLVYIAAIVPEDGQAARDVAAVIIDAANSVNAGTP